MSDLLGQNVGPPLRIPDGPQYDHARELLGKAVRIRREKAGLSQVDAAKLLGISRDTLIRREKGEGSLWTGGPGHTVDHEQMTKLKETYGTKMSEILPRNQYPSAPADPRARREYFIRANARIQGENPDDAVARFMAADGPEPSPKGA